MDLLELSRQLTDRTVRTPRKLGQAPYRTLQLAAGETPYDVVYEEHPVRLRWYDPEQATDATPVVIAYAFINDPSILDSRRIEASSDSSSSEGSPSTSSTREIRRRSIARSGSRIT